MEKKLENIEIIAKILRKKVEKFDDDSSKWITFEDDQYAITIGFDGEGNKFKDITVSEKIYDIVDEPIIAILK